MEKNSSVQSGHQHSDQCSHHHAQAQNDNNLEQKHPLLSFFQCCLDKGPAELSERIQTIRRNLPNSHQIEEIDLQSNQALVITKDMIIGDILLNFPETRTLIEEIHPLGLLSPMLNSLTIEIFFSDQNLDLEEICLKLTQLIHQSK